jgi:cell division protein FtsQ
VSTTQTPRPTTRPRVLPAVPRLEARARAERRFARLRRLRGVGVAVAAILLLLGMAWLVLASPLFDVDRIKVVGADGSAADQVVQSAAIRRGVALATVDLGGARERVAALPAVASVRVTRSWPGSVVITVTPRVPMVAVNQADGTVGLMAADGIVVSSVAAGASVPAGLPALSVPAPGPTATDPTTRAALRAFDELPPNLRSVTTVITGVSPESVVFAMGGRNVIWGPPGDAAIKGAAVTALLAKPGGQIDVTSPQVAVVQGAVP